MTKRSFLFAATLALAAASFANAQIDSGNSVEYDWGAAHMVSGQAVVLNFTLSGDGAPLNLPVQFEIHDKNGATLYRNTVMVSAGRTISLAIGSDVRTNVPADIYAVIAPDVRTIQPCIKVIYPPGPTAPWLYRLTPTLELMDTATGRVLGFANNPHAIIGVLAN